MASSDAVATLGRLQASGLAAQGKINVITLDAIAEQLGRRWAMRRELVYDHAERTLERQLGSDGFFQRISDTDYVVSQPDVSSLAGQAKCLICLREILHHFLGAALIGDIRVHTVTRISPQGVYGERLDVAAVEEAGALECAANVKEAHQAGSLDQWSPFVTSNGQRVRVSCALEPLILLKTFAKIGYRLARRVLELPSDQPLSAAAQRNLSRADIEKIDFATISRGLDRLLSEASSAKPPSLILPVSYVTLSNHHGRAVVIDLLRRAQEAVRHGVICEICDIEGVPPGARSTVASLIRPFCIYVVGRLNETPAGLANLKGAGLQALTIECPPAMAGDAEFVGWTRTVLAAARPVTRSVMLYRLASNRQIALANALGASHASLRPAELKTQMIDD